MGRVEITEVVLNPTSGQGVAGASVQVNVRGGAAATVYQAATGATTLSNPLSTDAYGRIEGWLKPGRYDLVVSAAQFDTYTLRLNASEAASTEVTSVTRDGSNRVTEVVAPGSSVTAITRDAGTGLVTGFTSDGIAYTVSRDGSNRITGVTAA